MCIIASFDSHNSFKLLLSLYIQGTGQKGGARDYITVIVTVAQYFDKYVREKNFSSRVRQLEKPASGAAPKRCIIGDCIQWTREGGQCSRGDSVE